jgi:hypothetical protein
MSSHLAGGVGSPLGEEFSNFSRDGMLHPATDTHTDTPANRVISIGKPVTARPKTASRSKSAEVKTVKPDHCHPSNFQLSNPTCKVKTLEKHRATCMDLLARLNFMSESLTARLHSFRGQMSDRTEELVIVPP